MKEKLRQYEELVVHREMLSSRKAELIADAIPAEVKAEIDAIEAEINPEIEEMDEKIASLAKELKSYVASTGEKLVGERYQVIFTKPRKSWDNNALEGYSVAHPEILAFQKVGKPSASIRARGRS